MNFQMFKDTYFEGNREKALECLAREDYSKEFHYTKDREQCRAIILELTGDDAKDYMHFLGAEMEKNPKRLKMLVDQGVNLGLLGMEYDEVLNAKKNPFVKPVLLKLLGVFAPLLLLLLLALVKPYLDFDVSWFSYSAVGTILVAGGFGASVAGDIVRLFLFRKVKKQMRNDD